MLATLWQDLSYGARLMRRRPAFSATAVLVLSLGIGINAALFSVVNALFFRSLPVNSPEQLFYVYQREAGGRTVAAAFGIDEFELATTRTAMLADYAAHLKTQMTLSVENETERVRGELVSGNYFDVLGVPAALGRPLHTHDDAPATAPAVVISHGLWVRWFHSQPTALGTSVRFDDGMAVIVGVMPEGFRGLTDPLSPSEFWMAQIAVDRRLRGVPIGRMKPGATMADVQNAFRALNLLLAEAKLARLRQNVNATISQPSPSYAAHILKTEFPVRAATDVEMPSDPESRLIPQPLVAGVIGVVALVLLIATANIAGLLLARGVTRTGEVAVRRALGAGQSRLVRQLLTESVLLAGISGPLGLALAIVLVGVFRANTPMQYAIEVVFDLRVVLFAAAACLITGVLTGLAPARQAARVNVLQALGGGAVGSGAVRRRLRHAIVIPQVALSLVLLAIATVQVRALMRVEFADPGYRAEGVMVFGVERSTSRSADVSVIRESLARRRALYPALAERMATVPGIAAFGVTSQLPLNAPFAASRIVREEDFARASEMRTEAAPITTSAGYFEAMGIRVVRGRAFDLRDTAGAVKVAVLSETAARTLWSSGNPIGHRIAFMQGARPRDWVEIVGVVNDVRPVFAGARDVPIVYMPIAQSEFGFGSPTLVVRGAGNSAGLVREVRAAALAADPRAQVWRVRALSQLVGDLLYPRRLAAAVLIVTGLIGLFLASIGLYGVVSYSVEQRVREIGIRTTLGADRGDIIALVLREGVTVTALGSLVGLGLAAFALRWASSVIPALPRGDFVSFAGVTVALAGIIVAACLVPAYRASRVDPAKVLRGN